MHDVAAKAGVSLKTVSRVINNEPGVADQTAHRVQAAVLELGFQRNDVARSLRSRSTRTGAVGLVIEDVSNPFYGSLARAIEDVAWSHEAILISVSSGEDPDREEELVDALLRRRVDGLIIVPAASDHTYLRFEVALGTPVVFVDRPAGGISVDTVLLDNRGGSRDMATYLFDLGHRRIGAVVHGHGIVYTAVERLTGFREGLESHGLELDESLVRFAGHDEESAQSATDDLVSIEDPPTAVFASNNRMTIGCLKALRQRDTRPVVVGFDDFETAGLLSPPVTVVRADPGEVGRIAARLLYRDDRGDSGPRFEMAPAHLIDRGTQSPPG